MDHTEEPNPVKDIPQSRMVAWWPVLLFVAERLGVEPTTVPDIARKLPLLGTPAWCELPGGDPAKLAAVLDGGCRWALRLELGQEALAEASRAVAAAADWRAVAAEMTQRQAFRAANPWANRVVVS